MPYSPNHTKHTFLKQTINSDFHQIQGTKPQLKTAGVAGYGGAQNRVGNAIPGRARQIKCYNCNGGQDNAVDEDVDEQPVQDLALNVDNVFQAEDCDAFDSNIDEAPMAQTMFMANLSSVDPVYDEAGPSYDSDILFEVHDHDHYQDVVCVHHEEHEMHDDVQPDYVVDPHADYTSDSNMILYDQYVKDNAVLVVQKREQKIDEQLRIVITDCNRKEERLKRELHSIKLQLTSTINHNKWGAGATGYGGAQNRVGNANPGQARQAQENEWHGMKSSYLFIARWNKTTLIDEEVYEKPDQDFSTQYPVYDEAGPSYDSDILSEVHDHDHYQDAICEHHVEHEMHDDVQPNYVVDSHANYTSDGNMIPYDQYVKDNAVPVVQSNVSSVPHDAYMMIFNATFPPQKQLTPEQIFWSNDLIEMKAEALKEQTKASRPIKALTMYPPNTPSTLVPRVLPTKRLTEGERDFKQTKECYLIEVIPFFKTLKEHFEGIQKALTKEIKEMKDIFEEMEAEVEQNFVNSKHDEIEQKNLLIANENFIVDCLSKEVFYIATNSELTLKYQHLKESFGNKPSPPARETPNLDSVFIIRKIKASIQGKDNAIKKLKMQIFQLQDTRSEADCTLDVRALNFQIIQLTEKVTTLQEKNELFRAENAQVKQHYKELYAIDVEPIPPNIRNNREVHLDYLKHLKESVKTLREIVEET
ncbi:hypothetical protein Tco_0788091 [Tanacetum coccineum]